MKLIGLIGAFCIIGFNSILGQNALIPLSSASKNAKEYYNKGSDYENLFKTHLAIQYYTKALKKEPNIEEPILKLGYLYGYLRDYPNSILYYQQYIDLATEPDPRVVIALANSYFYNDDLDKALQYYTQAKAKVDPNSNLARLTAKGIADTKFSIQNKSPLSNTRITKLPSTVNSEYGDYFPGMTADESLLLFTRNLNGQEDFFYSKKVNGAWENAEPLQELNTPENEGAQCISADGKSIIFTACDRPKGFGRCDLYLSELIDGHWSEPTNLGPGVNGPSWDSQPTLSADGRLLIFSSDRDGQKDLFMSHKNEKGKWSKSVALPSQINTSSLEDSPFLAADGEILFFSSEGHPGFGGADLFYSKRKGINEWTTPTNLGQPINSKQSETTLITNYLGNKGIYAKDSIYYDTNKDIVHEKHAIDLYQFEFPKLIRPKPTSYIQGKIFDADTKEPLMAQVKIYNVKMSKVVSQPLCHADGTFFAALPFGQDYSLSVSKKGYSFYSDFFDLKDSIALNFPFSLEIGLRPISPDVSSKEIIQLKNIFFPSNSYQLDPSSFRELQQIKEFLTENPYINVRVNGHTDDIGSEKDNLTLSDLRAKEVVKYLVKEGIAPERLQSQGYGESKPIVPNDSPRNRAANRRTELEIL